MLVGDLNVAPLENDVWSHKQLLDVVSHTPVETQLLGEALAAFDWTDATRALRSAGRENLFLVELSRRRLGSIGPRPPAGPCLAQPRAERRAQIADHPEKDARLAKSLATMCR